MKKSRNDRLLVNKTLHILGLLLCIVPPSVCTLLYFPLWKSGGSETVMAGGAALLLAICAMPVFKMAKRLLSSPASYVMWLIAFLLFFFVSKIANEMTVISFVGLVSNLLGAVLFRIAKRGGCLRDEK